MNVDLFLSHGAFIVDEPVQQRMAEAYLEKTGRHAADLEDAYEIEDIIAEIAFDKDYDLHYRSIFFGDAIPLEEAKATNNHHMEFSDDYMVCIEPQKSESLFTAAYPSFDALVDEYIQRLRDNYGVELDTRRDYEVRVCDITGYSD